ncbi:MAG: hypothetical protein HY075_07300 [Deltaproteobacteria bacterium]|nr:hypothetical protein [Deltaproteobacteria bacterium]
MVGSAARGARDVSLERGRVVGGELEEARQLEQVFRLGRLLDLAAPEVDGRQAQRGEGNFVEIADELVDGEARGLEKLLERAGGDVIGFANDPVFFLHFDEERLERRGELDHVL